MSDTSDEENEISEGVAAQIRRSLDALNMALMGDIKNPDANPGIIAAIRELRFEIKSLKEKYASMQFWTRFLIGATITSLFSAAASITSAVVIWNLKGR